MGGKKKPNTQHKCCGNMSCNNRVDPLAHLLSHVSLRKFYAPATLQQPCARLCVSRPARAMPPKPSPPERPNQGVPGSSLQPPPPSPAAWPMANAKFRPLVPIDRWSTVPKAQPIHTYEHIDTSCMLSMLVQPKTPPYNVFGP